MKRSTDASPAEVEARVREELQKEGFGVLTEIDVAAVLKAKLGVERPAYKILGACNPNFAREALDAEPDIGTLLPCNVCIYQEDGRTVLSAMKPTAALALTEDPRIEALATKVEEILWRAISRAAPDAVRISGPAV